MYRQV